MIMLTQILSQTKITLLFPLVVLLVNLLVVLLVIPLVLLVVVLLVNHSGNIIIHQPMIHRIMDKIIIPQMGPR